MGQAIDRNCVTQGCAYLRRDFKPTLAELHLESLDKHRVHLTDAALAEAERVADLFHR